MLIAFTLGLLGSFTHCVGMCSGVVMILTRRGWVSGRGTLLLAHAGRLTTYSLLGLSLGGLGYLFGLTRVAESPASAVFRAVQGALAMLAALIALYLAFALLGRVPSPEVMLSRLTRRWGHAMRALSSGKRNPVHAYAIGLLWGLLPCGLVLTALLTAVVAPSPAQSALTMLAFGLGTMPAVLGVGWLARRGGAVASQFPHPQMLRSAAALLIMVFSAQMALRGLAAWGWVGHAHLGRVMLW